MATVRVREHLKRAKWGGVSRVRSHVRQVSPSETLLKLRAKIHRSIGKKVVANEWYDRYKDRPVNLKLMFDSRWKEITVRKPKTDKGGITKWVSEKKRRWVAKETDWADLIRQNIGLVYKVASRYNYWRGIQDDLMSEGRRALMEAANNYEGKFNAKEPYDIGKHFYTHIAGFVQAEVGRQLATRIKYPSYKGKVFTRFKESYARHGADYDTIYDELKLTKRDLYPAIKTDGDARLPKMGYVSVVKDEVYEKKLRKHERHVNVLKDKYGKEHERLDRKFEEGKSAELRRDYEDAIKRFNRQEARYRKEGNVSKAKEIAVAEKNYETQFAPLSKAEYQSEKKVVNKNYQAELREAKKELDGDLSRTSIKGAYELFREFEELMHYKYVDMTDVRADAEGDLRNMDEMIITEQISPVGEIMIREQFLESRNKLMDAIESLESRTGEIVKLKLGLHDQNELYEHGLWGKPMVSDKEITGALPDKFWRTKEGAEKYGQRVANWEKKKPTKAMKAKRTDKELMAVELAWRKRRKLAIREIKKMYGSKFGATKDQSERVYKKHRARMTDIPGKFFLKNMTDAQYNKALKYWKLSKPQQEVDSYVARLKIVRDELDFGWTALRRILAKKDIDDLVLAYQSMRRYGIRKAHVIEDLRKSLEFDKFWRVKYIPKRKGVLYKAFKKVKGFWPRIAAGLL